MISFLYYIKNKLEQAKQVSDISLQMNDLYMWISMLGK